MWEIALAEAQANVAEHTSKLAQAEVQLRERQALVEQLEEDRAHQQVDQARQEIKSLQQRLERQQRDHDKRVAELATQHNELRSAQQAANHAAAHQAGRVAALEAALAQWQHSAAPSKRRSTKSGAAVKAEPGKRSRKAAATK